MKERKEYMEPDHLPQETEKFFASTKINWSRSKDEVWMELEKKIEAKSKVEVKSAVRIIGQVWIRVAVAAVLVLLVGISALITLYTKTIVVPVGMHSEVYLPDKSLVKLNAQSTLNYKPLTWRFSRTLKFEGEAYFEIEKGKQMEVISTRGKTVVLGTTFNIYSRSDHYQVTCFSGRVKVKERAGIQEVILNSDQQTALDTDGILTVESGIDTEQTLSWLNNRFSFTSVPLGNVFEEIGRQYGVLIEIPKNLDNTYTGTFMKDSSVENVLNLVCRPFDLKTIRKSENEYVITRNN
jgi:transmembrane sensor